VGISHCEPEDLAGQSPAYNADSLREALTGRSGPHQDALVLGAALALEVTGRVTNSSEAVALARETIAGGAAASLLDQLAEFGTTARIEANGG